jgi:hypothetical protein
MRWVTATIVALSCIVAWLFWFRPVEHDPDDLTVIWRGQPIFTKPDSPDGPAE